MTRVLVVGGTGVAGRQVALELLERGYQVRTLTRHGGTPFTDVEHVLGDLVTGEGLTEALTDVDLIVDTTDAKSPKARAVFTEGATNLLKAAQAEGISRAVLLSIINVDKSEFPYYVAKTAQEKVYSDSALETVIVRATQFHDFLPFLGKELARVGLLPAFPRVRFQTIDTRDVATALADALIEGTVPEHPVTIGGPLVESAREMQRTWKNATGARGLIINVPLPRALGKFFRAGLNLLPEDDSETAYGTITFEQWAREQQR